MKVNYVLLYGNPYLITKFFENFSDLSNYILNKRITDYSLYELMTDQKEIEMIYLESDISFLKNENLMLRKQLDFLIKQEANK